MRPRPVRQGLSAVVPIPGEMQVKEALASVCERNITNPPHPHARATFSKNTNLRPALLAQDLNAPLRIPVLAPRPARPYLRLDLQLSWPWRRCGRFSVFVGSFQRSARTLLPVVNFVCLPRPQHRKLKRHRSQRFQAQLRPSGCGCASSKPSSSRPGSSDPWSSR